MGPKSSSGFYLSRTSAGLLALLLGALLLALVVLGALYARSSGGEHPAAPTLPDTSAETITGTPLLSTLFTETTGPPGIWDNHRLPHHLLPLHYDLELWPRLTPDAEGNYPLTGQVNITLSCQEGTDLVLLHCHKLNITRAELRHLGPQSYKSGPKDGIYPQPGIKGPEGAGVRGRAHPQDTDPDWSEEEHSNIAISSMWLSGPHQYLVLQLERPLIARHRYLLRLDYRGHLSDDYSGLSVTHYRDWGQESMKTGGGFPSKLEFTPAEEIVLGLLHPVAVGGHAGLRDTDSPTRTHGISEREGENGTKWTVTTFNTTLRMSTYITAFVVCDCDYISTTERGSEIRIWGRKEMIQKGYANFSLKIAGPLLSFMEDLLNVSYPLQKTDLVAMPEFGVGAMENWGLITFQESSLMYNPKHKFSNSKALTCLIVAHEIGHQWFGNLVTMKWWNDIWLNEGFASYMEYIGASFAEPKLKLDELFMLHNLVNIFEKDARTSARAVSVKEDTIEHVNDIILLFDVFTYTKGAALLRMASTFLTDRLFFKGISSYLKRFSFSNAEQDDVWNHMQMFIDDQYEVQLPATLKEIMNSWTWQKGVPLVTLNTSTGTLTQEQFTTASADNVTEESNNTWIIPISWMKNGILQPTIWLDAKTKTVSEMKTTHDNEWIILNLNVTGYYRINYDEKNWNSLARILEEEPEVLSVVNRVQLIDDAFTLANNGYLQYETALNLTRYLEQELDVIVWYILLKHYYRKSLVTYHSFPFIKKYFLKRINPIFQHYASILRRNFDETADNFFVHTGIDVIFKTACSLGLQDCLDLAREIYAKWMTNISSNEIPQSIRGTIYCYGIAEGGEKEWEFAWNVYNKSDPEDHIEQSYLKQGMSCTKEPWLLYRYLKKVIDFDSHTIVSVFLDMFKHDIGRHIAWEFLKENWHRLNDMYMKESGQFYETLLPDLGWKATSELQFQEMQLFITTTMDESDRESELLKLEIRKKARLEWINLVNTRIIDWLQKNTLDLDF